MDKVLVLVSFDTLFMAFVTLFCLGQLFLLCYVFKLREFIRNDDGLIEKKAKELMRERILLEDSFSGLDLRTLNDFKVL